MRDLWKRSFLQCFFFICLLAFFAIGTSAASTDVQRITSSDLTSAVESYKQSNPSAAQHTITTSHKVVYDADSYFKDIVNGTTSYFSCYSKKGCDALVDRLSDLGVRTQGMSDANAAAAREIHVGIVDRSAQSAYLPLLDVNEYAIVATQDQIMLLAWQDAALKTGVDTFIAYLNKGARSLPVGFVGIGVANSSWKVDFVRPEGNDIALSAGQFVNDDSLQFLYTGDGVSAEAYLTYCAQLEADGFTLVWQNTVGNNEFRGYENRTKAIALYVAYNDYTYKAEFDVLYQANYGTYDDTFDPQFEKCIRIVSSPRSAITVPAASLNSQQTYTKVTDSHMTLLSIAEKQVGSGYVILLEDGRFVVIDGGNVSSKKNGVYPESQAIWDAMLALYKKAYGASATPSVQRPLHVAAWYLTHAHSDHYNAFYYMLEMIAADTSKKSVFKMDYMIANMIGERTMFENTSTRWGYGNSEVIHNIKNKVGGFTFLKVHAGQKIYFANLMIEVLMTFEDHLPATIYNTNDTNTITRFHFHNGAAAVGDTVTSFSGKSTTVMFLGDSWRPASRFLCAMYGDYLKSDISQIAHHGNIGCEKELYAQIAPTAILFNHDLSMFRKYVWGSTTDTNPESQHAYAVDQYVVKQLGTVGYVFAAVAGVNPTLCLSEEGACYDSAFALLTGKTLTYSDINDAASSQNGFVKITLAHVHAYGGWQQYSATQHKRECACGEIEYAAHRWDSGTVDTPATHDAPGVKLYACTDCGETKEAEIPQLTAHEYGAWQKHDDERHKRMCICGDTEYAAHNWDNGVITTPATHTVFGVKTYTCVDCDERKTEKIPMTAAHEYGAWQKHDDERHKRMCICGDTEHAAHNWDNGVITTPATHTVFGVKTYTCVDCDERKTEKIPMTAAHEYGAWQKHDDERHKRMCICGDTEYATHNWDNGVISTPATHTLIGVKTYTCIDCEESKEEDIPMLTSHENIAWQRYDAMQHQRICSCGDVEYAAHGWDSGVITTPATHTVFGVKTYTCVDCGERKTEKIPMTAAHEHGAWQKQDEMQHKRVCSCGDVEYAAHGWNSGVITTPATHTAFGTKTYTCVDCGERKTEKVPMTVAHEYGAWQKHDDMQHKRVCACTDVQYVAHHWDEGVITTPATHTALGVKSYTCVDCGAEKFESLPKVAHNYSEWVIIDEASLDKNGKRERYCDCGEVEQVVLPALNTSDTQPGTGSLDSAIDSTADDEPEVQSPLKKGTVIALSCGGIVLLGGVAACFVILRKKKLRL